MTAIEDRRAAVRAQLAGLSEPELRMFAEILAADVEAVELPLAEFLAEQARQHEHPGSAEAVRDLGSSRDMLALVLAREAGDDDTVQLIRERGVHWRMLSWAISALCAQTRDLGADPSDWARYMIAYSVQEEAGQRPPESVTG